VTVTDIRPYLTAQPERTPESQRAENLLAMLDDPTLAGYHDQIRASLAALTATTVLAA
jgi:hypothetical protein